MTTELASGHSNESPGVPGRIHRRALLQGAFVAAAVVVASPLMPTAASAAVRAQLAAHGIRKGTTRVHGPAGTATDMPMLLGAALEVGTALPSGTILTLVYDSRLYRLRPDLIVTRAGAGSAGLRHRHRAVEQSGPSASVDVVLDEPLSPGRYEVVAGVVSPRRYPDDLIADPLPLRLRARSATGELLADTVLSRPAAKDEVPWGAVLGAAWVTGDGDHAEALAAPGLVTLFSAGPAAVPAGARIRVLLDNQAFAAVGVAGATLSDGASFAGTASSDTVAGFARSTWTSGAELPAGARVTLVISVEPRLLAQPLPSLQPPLIEFGRGSANSNVQRYTAGESLTR